MRQLIFVFTFLFSAAALGQNAEIGNLKALQQRINATSDSILVVNFWATWCAPCVKELPLFEKLNAEAKSHVSVLLVSMDLDLDPNPDKVYRFVDRKQMKSKIFLLNEKDPNSWIDQIDKNWSGALPATIVINQKTGRRKFIEKELHDGDLEKIIAEVQ